MVFGRHAGIPKLDDANDAGGRNSGQCTLILTEGDSAKALAISGLSVVGRDQFGVFPLRGKLLNVREASSTQVCPPLPAFRMPHRVLIAPSHMYHVRREHG